MLEFRRGFKSSPIEEISNWLDWHDERSDMSISETKDTKTYIQKDLDDIYILTVQKNKMSFSKEKYESPVLVDDIWYEVREKKEDITEGGKMKYEALPGNIIVKQDEDEIVQGGVILINDKDMPITGVVISSGMEGVKEGDRVVYGRYSGKHSGRSDKHMVTVNEDTVMGVIV